MLMCELLQNIHTILTQDIYSNSMLNGPHNDGHWNNPVHQRISTEPVYHKWYDYNANALVCGFQQGSHFCIFPW